MAKRKYTCNTTLNFDRHEANGTISDTSKKELLHWIEDCLTSTDSTGQHPTSFVFTVAVQGAREP